MKFKFTVFAILLFNSGFSQKTKEVFNKKTNEMYEVLKSDKAIKHGYYHKYGYNNKLITKGYFKNDTKDSIWTFYNVESEIIQKFDYNRNDIIFYRLDEWEKKRKILLINSNSENINFDRPPIYLGGSPALFFHLGTIIRYPAEAQKANKSGISEISFEIDEWGNTSNYKYVKRIGYGMDEEAMRVLKEISSTNWIPAVYQGKKVAVKYHFPVVFKLD